MLPDFWVPQEALRTQDSFKRMLFFFYRSEVRNIFIFKMKISADNTYANTAKQGNNKVGFLKWILPWLGHPF